MTDEQETAMLHGERYVSLPMIDRERDCFGCAFQHELYDSCRTVNDQSEHRCTYRIWIKDTDEAKAAYVLARMGL